MVKPVSADCCGAYLCDGVFVVNTGGILRYNPMQFTSSFTDHNGLYPTVNT